MQSLKAVFVALLVAVFGTISHQTQINGLPLGILLAFAAVVIGALESRQGRYSRLVFPVALGLFTFLFAQDWSGDKLIPANEIGYIWSYGAVLLASIVSLWPKVRTHR